MMELKDKYTSVEQSKKLIKAGLDPNTADQYYWAQQRFDGNDYVNTGVLFHEFKDDGGLEYDSEAEYANNGHFGYLNDTFGASGRYEDDDDSFIPCWSVGALIDILPTELEIQGKRTHFSLNQWMCKYETDTNDGNDGKFGFYGRPVKRQFNGKPIASLTDMVCYLLDNGYLEKTE